jgi:hypothetical protein
MNRSKHNRSALTLLEVTLSLGLMAILLAPTVGIMRTSLELWHGFESTHTKNMQQAAIVRYVNARLTRVETVQQLQPNQLVVRLSNGKVDEWFTDGHTVTVDNVNVDQSGVETILQHSTLSQLQTISFSGFKADGETTASLANDVKLIGVTMSFNGTNEQHTSYIRVRQWE